MLVTNYKFTSFFFIKSFFFNLLLNDLSYFMVISLLKYKYLVNFLLFALPPRIRKFTVVKSPFVSKLSREQFEIRVFKNVISIRYNNSLLLHLYKDFIKNFKNSYVSLRLCFK